MKEGKKNYQSVRLQCLVISLCVIHTKKHSWGEVAHVWNPSIQESESHREILSQNTNLRKHLKESRQPVSDMWEWWTNVKVHPSVAIPLGQGFGPHNLLCPRCILFQSLEEISVGEALTSMSLTTPRKGGQASQGDWGLELREGCCIGEVHVPQTEVIQWILFCWWRWWDTPFQGREDFFRALRKSTDGFSENVIIKHWLYEKKLTRQVRSLSVHFLKPRFAEQKFWT